MKRESSLLGWPAGAGEAAALARGLDARRSPLGAPPAWPQALRTTLELMLPAHAQMVLFWGPELVALYNDAYAPTIGLKHPTAFGRPAAENWAELWDDLGPLLNQVLQQGESFSAIDRPFHIDRHGHLEEVFFDVSFSPVREANDHIGGVLCLVNETTERVHGRLALAESETRLRDASRRTALALSASAIVGTWMWDVQTDMVFADEALATAFSLQAPDRQGGLPISRFLEAIHPDDLSKVQAAIAESLAQGAPYRVEYRVRTLDARWRWVEASGYVEHDAMNRPLRFPGVMVDIDSRKLAEQALRETNKQLRLAQAAGGIGVFLLDIATNELSVSAEFCRIFGVPVRPEFQASVVEALRIDAVEPMSTLTNRVDGSLRLNVEYPIRRADDQSLRWIARRAELVRNDAGKPMLLRGVVQDITGAKQVEATLRQSEGRFRALAQAVPNQVWTAAGDGRLDWFNDQVYEYSGMHFEQLEGNGWATIVHPDDLPDVVSQWQLSLATQLPYAAEFRLRRLDGDYRWHLVRAHPVQDGDGHVGETGEGSAPMRWVGTNTDINDQKAAQERLAQSVEERTRDRDRLWQLSADIMVVGDFDGIIRAINPAWETLLGWTEAELVGQPLLDFVHPDDIDSTVAEIAKLSRGQITLRFENRYRHKDGSYRTLSWSAVPDTDSLHAVGRDITALRDSESRLRQSQKMEAIGQLTGGIAHDFNNLLQGITGSIEIVRRRVALGRTDDLDRYMSSATQSAHRAAALIQRLLAFSRRQTLNPRAVDVNALIGSMEDLLRRTLSEQVRLEVQLADGVGAALGDEPQLESAILNLAINARDAMPHGGALILSTGHATLRESETRHHEGLDAGDYIAISVADTGTGMSPEVLAKVFDPFFTTKPIGQGTGLGLSMVYGFAQQSRGHVRIESRVGHGTRVTLYLPPAHADAAAAVEAEAAAAALPQGRGEVVMVVEDDPAVRLLVLDVLADLGYRTIEAVDGTTAMPILQSAVPIDLLVTDVGLPGINGRQLAEFARQQRPGLHVLFMTGYAEHATTRAEFLEPGMDLIAKPFAIDDFAQHIEQIVRGPSS
ncbi:PAS domain-containing protein [Variovorax sp. LG9.2]|uniref:PAS domain-containing protein n=1 Tax=Variovorax sp. LG9.2 TaxID=3048626 RepID=UPI002B2362B7|nr:PAS domain-containing protein [Variovorax sp. LG9.2]MEB0058156.1 PAS domain-containing protein [Variovorax sp. LG9.2]